MLSKQLLDQMREEIEKKEGRKSKMYMLDGVPHIAIGHSIISRTLSDETRDFLGIDDESELMKVELTDEQIDYLFEKDLEIAIKDVITLIGEESFAAMSDLRKKVITDLSFNLGRPRLSKFVNFLAAVKNKDWDEAANQILDSKAARDPLTKKRYEGLAEEMRIGFVEPADAGVTEKKTTEQDGEDFGQPPGVSPPQLDAMTKLHTMVDAHYEVMKSIEKKLDTLITILKGE